MVAKLTTTKKQTSRIRRQELSCTRHHEVKFFLKGGSKESRPPKRSAFQHLIGVSCWELLGPVRVLLGGRRRRGLGGAGATAAANNGRDAQRQNHSNQDPLHLRTPRRCPQDRFNSATAPCRGSGKRAILLGGMDAQSHSRSHRYEPRMVIPEKFRLLHFFSSTETSGTSGSVSSVAEMTIESFPECKCFGDMSFLICYPF